MQREAVEFIIRIGHWQAFGEISGHERGEVVATPSTRERTRFVTNQAPKPPISSTQKQREPACPPDRDLETVLFLEIAADKQTQAGGRMKARTFGAAPHLLAFVRQL